MPLLELVLLIVRLKLLLNIVYFFFGRAKFDQIANDFFWQNKKVQTKIGQFKIIQKHAH